MGPGEWNELPLPIRLTENIVTLKSSWRNIYSINITTANPLHKARTFYGVGTLKSQIIIVIIIIINIIIIIIVVVVVIIIIIIIIIIISRLVQQAVQTKWRKEVHTCVSR